MFVTALSLALFAAQSSNPYQSVESWQAQRTPRTTACKSAGAEASAREGAAKQRTCRRAPRRTAPLT